MNLKRFSHRYWKNQNELNTVSVLVIEYCNLRFICNLVLVIWDFKWRNTHVSGFHKTKTCDADEPGSKSH
jgi:hypothetical protein